MSDWVRFHRELLIDEKAGIPRAFRFIYMELSQKARPRKGYIVLPQGMPDAKAVEFILAGDRKEVSAAVKALSEGPDPMIRFDVINGKRSLIVVNWKKWNPGDETAAERQARARGRAREKTESERDVTRDESVTGSESHESRHGVSLARARPRALISSPLLSESEISEGEPEREPPQGLDPTSETRIKNPESAPMRAAETADDDGAFGDTTRQFASGVKSVTGREFLLPPHRSAEMAKLVTAIVSNAKTANEREKWAFDNGAKWAASKPDRWNVHGFVDWLNAGSPKESGPKIRSAAPTVQPAPPGGSHWKVGGG